MSAALAEPLDVVTTRTNPSATRAAASRANGRLSHGPATPEGKQRSRRNGCKEGLTGAGIVLPPEAEKEVARREAEFAQEFRPRNAVERDLVRQMALGAWRGQILMFRIIQHDARMNASRFARWEEDEQIAVAEIARKLADEPEAVVAQLKRTGAGCDWLIGRWNLLGNALKTADEGGPDCSWTDADLTLALNLLGRPLELRHLDDLAARLESLRQQARAGSDEAVTALREILASEVAELEDQFNEVWEGVEEPTLQGWRAGIEIDLGPEGTRLRRYEAAADRLFRSAWTKLERLRNLNGEPLMDPKARAAVPPQAPPPARPSPPPTAGRSPELPASSAFGPPDGAVVDFWIAGPPENGTGSLVQNKTNPAPGRSASGRPDRGASSPG